MSNEHNKNDGDDLTERLKQRSIFQLIEAEQIASRQFEVHPEAYHLRKISWEGMLTIQFESDSYTTDNGVAQSRRDDFVRIFMANLISYHWKLRHKHVYWVATTEFGASGVAHCHILISFLPLRNKGKKVPDLGFMDHTANDSIGFVCALIGCPRSSVDLQWEPKFDDFGLVGYFAKKEPGREDHKHFIWSHDGKNSTNQLLLHFSEQSEEVNQ